MLVMSCHNDIGDVNPDTEQTNQTTVPLVFNEIEGDLIGYIFDDSNSPIIGANVSIYSGATTTNEFGVFIFKDTKLDPQGTFVKVEKSGYLLGSDLVYPNSNGKGTAKIMMLKIRNVESFQASDGGTIEIEGGGTITFPPSSLIRANGSTYDGIVKSTAYRISSNDPELGVRMSGGLLGLDNKGRHRVLSTYGVMVVELRGFDNQKLRLKSDKVADLIFPIDNELQNFVENDVPAWSFNFDDGLWHENIITSNDKQNFYVSINTLGYWNMALSSGISQVCGKLIYDNQLPAENYEVQIINNGLPSRIGITDHDGFFCGKVPLGENLKFQVLHPICGGIIKELNLDPFEDVGTIGDVVIEVDEIYISGTIECNGELNENSTIIIVSNGLTNIFYPNANGAFSINLEAISCNSSSSFSIFAYNDDTETASEILELSSNSSEPLTLDVCDEVCTAELVFTYVKDDYCTDGEYNRVLVEVLNGSEDYTYEWQDGSANSFFNDPSSGGEVCVSVKDIVTGCDYFLCDEVSSHKRLSIESMYASNTECLLTSGFIVLDVAGGREPLTYEWEGPDGFTSNDAEVKDLSPGIYTVIIKDDSGCDVTESVIVQEVTTQFELMTEDFCNATRIIIQDIDGYKPYTYKWSVEGETGDELYVYTAGNYGVTITDANLCIRSNSVVLANIGTLPEISPAYNCDAGIITFSDMEEGFDYYYQSFGSSDKIPINMVNGKLDVSIIEAGYRFEIGSENPLYSDCLISETINLPQFEGLEVGSINNASCDTCADGHIEYEVNTSENCQDCEVGGAIVIDSENGDDVTEINVQMQLEKGEYYVIVLDSNSGCYIAHELVILD